MSYRSPVEPNHSVDGHPPAGLFAVAPKRDLAKPSRQIATASGQITTDAGQIATDAGQITTDDLRERDELDRIAGRTAELGELLIDLNSGGLDRALTIVFSARRQLDLTERQLVRLARQTGRSWAQIGAEMGVSNGRSTRERFGRTQ